MKCGSTFNIIRTVNYSKVKNKVFSNNRIDHNIDDRDRNASMFLFFVA